MMNPVILFIPVSSTKGVGEYTRSIILAEALKAQIPDADIHFILNKHIDYGHTCPFNIHYSNHSATKDTPKVKKVLQKIQPDLVIFDCSGRSHQFAYAKALGAKVIFISQHKKKRARGLKIRRLLNSDIHWVVQPDFAIMPLSYLERLKLKMLGKKPPKNIGPILPRITQEESIKILKKHGLVSSEFFIFSAGSGGHKKNDLLAADIFYQAAVEFHRKTNIKCVMVFGFNYLAVMPTDTSILCIQYLPSAEFLTLLNEAKGRVISAGDTLLQTIELQKPSVAAAVSKDQPARLDACAKFGLAKAAENNSRALCDQAITLLNPKVYQAIEMRMETTQPICGLDTAIADMKSLLKMAEGDCCLVHFSENEN
ncbi:MAG: hypothetical protein JKY15_01105, partial [Deltaproteobacteria bacterium]|nr:hypothetical protein [Deltaproteobacteria bacterium]